MIEILGEKARAAFWHLRRQAIIRAWSLKSAAQPLSFLEDGAVPIKNLAAYGAALVELFEQHGVRSAIYGQAGRGSLHVRPILNLRHGEDVRRMRVLGEEMADLLKSYGGVLTAGHGIGIARSEALERQLGPEATSLFAQLKVPARPEMDFEPGKNPACAAVRRGDPAPRPARGQGGGDCTGLARLGAFVLALARARSRPPLQRPFAVPDGGVRHLLPIL